MAITFDPTNRRIILDRTAVSAAEIWSRWADWTSQGDNLKWLPALRYVGGDTLAGGRSIPAYFFLLNGWRVRPMESNHTLVISGNLSVEGGGDPVVATLGSFNVLVQYETPVAAQAISTAGGSTGPSASQVADAVWQRLLEGGLSAEQIMRILMAPLAGKASGVGTAQEVYYGADGTTPRLTVQFDQAGNRTSVQVNGA